MSLYDAAKPALFALPPETAHLAVHRLLRTAQHTPVESVVRSRYAVDDDRLHTDVFGLSFDNPVGVDCGPERAYDG